jgi:molybdenum cofactor cytidylyltransferase
MLVSDKKPLAVAAIILAAGRSSRMGEQHKLLAQVGDTSIVARVVGAALKSKLVSTSVVVGHRAHDVENALFGKDIALVSCPEYARGLAESLKAGLASLPVGIDAVMILLADMPFVTDEHINALVDVFNLAQRRKIVVPVWEGRRGNPIIWPVRYIPKMMTLVGDEGARSILHACAESDVVNVTIPSDAVVIDVDTPAQLDAAQARYETRLSSE